MCCYFKFPLMVLKEVTSSEICTLQKMPLENLRHEKFKFCYPPIIGLLFKAPLQHYSMNHSKTSLKAHKRLALTSHPIGRTRRRVTVSRLAGRTLWTRHPQVTWWTPWSRRARGPWASWPTLSCRS